MFEELCKKLIAFDPEINAEKLRNELKSLASNWEKLKQSSLKEFEYDYVNEEFLEQFDDDTRLNS